MSLGVATVAAGAAGALTQTMAQGADADLIALGRRLDEATAAVRAARWLTRPPMRRSRDNRSVFERAGQLDRQRGDRSASSDADPPQARPLPCGRAFLNDVTLLHRRAGRNE